MLPGMQFQVAADTAVLVLDDETVSTNTAVSTTGLLGI